MKNHFNLKNIIGRKKKEPTKIVFTEPIRDSKIEASITLSKMDIPKSSQLEILEKAFSVGDMLIENLNNKILLDKDKSDLKKSFIKNDKIFEEIVTQRNIITSVIQDMIQPTINVTAGNSLQIEKHWKIFYEFDKRIQNLEQTIKNIYGNAPKSANTIKGKIPWGDTLKKAAEEIIELYKRDEGNSIRYYRSLRDASDEFYERHTFFRNPDLTKDMLYDNVKKANSFWGKGVNRRE